MDSVPPSVVFFKHAHGTYPTMPSRKQNFMATHRLLEGGCCSIQVHSFLVPDPFCGREQGQTLWGETLGLRRFPLACPLPSLLSEAMTCQGDPSLGVHSFLPPSLPSSLPSFLFSFFPSFSNTNTYNKPKGFATTIPILWRRQWHPTSVLLPGKSHGQRSLVGCSPWGR